MCITMFLRFIERHARLVILGVLLTSGACPTHAVTIISDGFSGVNGTSLAGHTPDTAHLPGSTYSTTTLATNNGDGSPTAQAVIDTSIPRPGASRV